jgi:hypothetical protein
MLAADVVGMCASVPGVVMLNEVISSVFTFGE